MNAIIDMQKLLPAWDQFRAATDISTIRDEAHYARMTQMLESLLDEAGGDEHHPIMGLVDIVGDLIEDYETEQHPLPETNGIDALKFLMEQHGLKLQASNFEHCLGTNKPWRSKRSICGYRLS